MAKKKIKEEVNTQKDDIQSAIDNAFINVFVRMYGNDFKDEDERLVKINELWAYVMTVGLNEIIGRIEFMDRYEKPHLTEGD